VIPLSERSNQCIVLRFLTKQNRYDSITTVIPNSQLGIGPGNTFQNDLLWTYIEKMYWGAKRRKADMRTLEWFVVGIGQDRTVLRTGHVIDQPQIPEMLVDIDTFAPDPHAEPEDREEAAPGVDPVGEVYGLVVVKTPLPQPELFPVEPVKPEVPRWTPPWQS